LNRAAARYGTLTHQNGLTSPEPGTTLAQTLADSARCRA